MLQLHAKMMGVNESRLRFDHSLLMNRPEARDAERDRAGWGGGGRKWHSHPYARALSSRSSHCVVRLTKAERDLSVGAATTKMVSE
jgi:hypothetical protein